MPCVSVGRQDVGPLGLRLDLAQGEGLSIDHAVGLWLAMEDAELVRMLLLVTLEYGPGSIRRVVVKHEDFVILIVLVQQAVQERADVFLLVAGWHKD